MKTISLDENLYQYLVDHSVREPEYLKNLREETAKLSSAKMQITPDQGHFMNFFLKCMGAKRAIEIGTYTGYSSLCIAEALGADGTLICCDKDPRPLQMAKKYWEISGLQDRIDLRLGDAHETIDQLVADPGNHNQFDFAFVDADKRGYAAYYEKLLQLIRPGGVIALDNVLWGGRVADVSDQTPQTLALRDINQQLHEDPRIELTMLSIGDGLTLARKL